MLEFAMNLLYHSRGMDSKDLEIITRLIEGIEDSISLEIKNLQAQLDIILDHLGLQTVNYEIIEKDDNSFRLRRKLSATDNSPK